MATIQAPEGAGAAVVEGSAALQVIVRGDGDPLGAVLGTLPIDSTDAVGHCGIGLDCRRRPLRRQLERRQVECAAGAGRHADGILGAHPAGRQHRDRPSRVHPLRRVRQLRHPDHRGQQLVRSRHAEIRRRRQRAEPLLRGHAAQGDRGRYAALHPAGQRGAGHFDHRGGLGRHPFAPDHGRRAHNRPRTPPNGHRRADRASGV